MRWSDSKVPPASTTRSREPGRLTSGRSRLIAWGASGGSGVSDGRPIKLASLLPLKYDPEDRPVGDASTKIGTSSSDVGDAADAPCVRSGAAPKFIRPGSTPSSVSVRNLASTWAPRARSLDGDSCRPRSV